MSTHDQRSPARSVARNGVSHCHVAKHLWGNRILLFQGQAGLIRRMEQHVYCLLVLSLEARTRSPCPISLQRGDIKKYNITILFL